MKSTSQSVSAKIARRWSWLAVIVALYYLATFTLGNNPAYMQKTIWIGALLVGLALAPMVGRHVRFRDIPREGVFLALFWLWTLTGFFVATEMGIYMRYLKLVLILTLIVTFIGLILKYSGSAKWFYIALLGAGILRLVYGDAPISMEHIAQVEDSMARIDRPNDVGFLCAMGFLGVLGLWGETRKLWWRVVLVAGGVLSLYGVILSASRGAFIALILTMVLWPVVCLVGSSRRKIATAIGAILLLLATYYLYQFVVHQTYMGVRFTKATELEDGSSRFRMELIVMGIQIFLDNPLIGRGLGQFGVASQTGYFSHNEIVEILATTGLPGFFLYYSVYVMSWLRLSWSLRYLSDPTVRFRINMARLMLLVLLFSGAIFRTNFLVQSSMFQLAVAVGMAHWAERSARVVRLQASASVLPGMPAGAGAGGAPPGVRNPWSVPPAAVWSAASGRMP